MTSKVQDKGGDSSPIRREVLSVGRHSLVYMVGQALSQAVGFFMIPVYTHFFAPENYGAMELIDIIKSIAALTISMGIAESMSRFYYAEKDESKRNHIISTVIIGFSLFGLPVVILFVAISGSISDFVLEGAVYRYYLQVAMLAVWFGMLCEIGFSYLRMMYKAKLFVVVVTLQLVTALSLNIWFVVYCRLDILGVFYSTLISQGLTGSLLAVLILRKVGLYVSPGKLWEIMKFGLPLVPSRVGLMLGFVSNRFFLRWMSSPDPAVALAQIGLYSLGHKFGVVVNRFVNAPFNSFWSPRRMELLLSDDPAAKPTVARICTYATMITLYVTLLLSAGIKSLIAIIADPSYIGAFVVVPIVALSYVALGLETHFFAGILYKKKTKWASYIAIGSLVVIIAWNYVFVPRFGLIGAATSTLAGIVVRVILVYFISNRLYPIPFELGRLSILMAMALATYLASRPLVFSSVYATFAAKTVFVGFFPLYLYLVRFFSRDELSFSRHILREGRASCRALVFRKHANRGDHL